MDELIQAELRRTHVRSESDELRSIQIILQQAMSEQEKRIIQLQEIIDEQGKRIMALEGQHSKEEQERINALEIKAHYLDHCRHASMNPMGNNRYTPYTPAPWKSSPTLIPAPPTKYSGIRGFFDKK